MSKNKVGGDYHGMIRPLHGWKGKEYMSLYITEALLRRNCIELYLDREVPKIETFVCIGRHEICLSVFKY